MLSALDVIDSKPGFVDIGYKTSSSEADKVEGNVTGSYGAGSPRRSKARNFLGIVDSELNKIVDEIDFSPEIEVKKEQTIDEIIGSILGELEFEL